MGSVRQIVNRFLCVLCALSGLYMTAQASNCGCDSTATWESAKEKANVILLGTCIDVSPNTIKGGLNVVFQVDSSWKRDIEQVATIHTNSPNQCGYPFKRGECYIVFATKRHQTIETSACEPNQVYADRGAITLRKLGKGFAPGREGFAGKMNMMLIFLCVLGLLFLGFVVLRKHLAKAKTVT
jgi:hypothetical protein